MPVIVVSNTKGGVGKTTVAQFLTYMAHKRGYKVALVDTEPRQRQITWVESTYPDQNNRPFLVQETNQVRIRDTLHKLDEEYDLVIIDTPGVNAQVSILVQTVADVVLIPVQASHADIKDAIEAYDIAQQTNQQVKQDIKVAMLFNQTDQRRVAYRRVREELSNNAFKVLDNVIPDAEVVRQMSLSSAGGIPTGGTIGLRIEKFFQEVIDLIQTKKERAYD